jgi:hypothetical protein
MAAARTTTKHRLNADFIRPNSSLMNRSRAADGRPGWCLCSCAVALAWRWHGISLTLAHSCCASKAASTRPGVACLVDGDDRSVSRLPELPVLGGRVLVAFRDADARAVRRTVPVEAHAQVRCPVFPHLVPVAIWVGRAVVVVRVVHGPARESSSCRTATTAASGWVEGHQPFACPLLSSRVCIQRSLLIVSLVNLGSRGQRLGRWRWLR